jgi:hypothetical protein
VETSQLKQTLLLVLNVGLLKQNKLPNTLSSILFLFDILLVLLLSNVETIFVYLTFDQFFSTIVFSLCFFFPILLLSVLLQETPSLFETLCLLSLFFNISLKPVTDTHHTCQNFALLISVFTHFLCTLLLHCGRCDRMKDLKKAPGAGFLIESWARGGMVNLLNEESYVQDSRATSCAKTRGSLVAAWLENRSTTTQNGIDKRDTNTEELNTNYGESAYLSQPNVIYSPASSCSSQSSKHQLGYENNRTVLPSLSSYTRSPPLKSHTTCSSSSKIISFPQSLTRIQLKATLSTPFEPVKVDQTKPSEMCTEHQHSEDGINNQTTPSVLFYHENSFYKQHPEAQSHRGITPEPGKDKGQFSGSPRDPLTVESCQEPNSEVFHPASNKRVMNEEASSAEYATFNVRKNASFVPSQPNKGTCVKRLSCDQSEVEDALRILQNGMMSDYNGDFYSLSKSRSTSELTAHTAQHIPANGFLSFQPSLKTCTTSTVSSLYYCDPSIPSSVSLGSPPSAYSLPFSTSSPFSNLDTPTTSCKPLHSFFLERDQGSISEPPRDPANLPSASSKDRFLPTPVSQERFNGYNRDVRYDSPVKLTDLDQSPSPSTSSDTNACKKKEAKSVLLSPTSVMETPTSGLRPPSAASYAACSESTQPKARPSSHDNSSKTSSSGPKTRGKRKLEIELELRKKYACQYQGCERTFTTR